MRASLCILLLLQVAADVDAVHKCCPSGKVLHLNGTTYTCVKPKAKTLRALRSNSPDDENHLPDCPGRLTVSTAATDQKIPDNSCVDREVGSEVLKVLRCPEDDGNRRGNDDVPSVLNVLKCCAEEEFYNASRHECERTDAANMTLSEKFTLMVGDNPDLVLFDVEVDIPRCDYALVDYSTSDYVLELGVAELVIRKGDDVITFDKGAFCQDVTGEGHAVARVCHEHTHVVCSNRPCVRKCCPDGEMFFTEDCRQLPKCQPRTRGFSPKFHNVTDQVQVHSQPPEAKPADYAILFGDPCGEFTGKYVLRPERPSSANDTSFLSHTDGRVVVPQYGDKSVHENHQYCLEDVYRPQCPGGNAHDKMDGIYTFICFRDDTITAGHRRRLQMYSIGIVISCVFIAATILVYLLLPKLQNLHGKTLLCYLFAMLAATAPLSYTQNSQNNKLTLCISLGYFIYFTFLVSFFWLNVMCFDIWWTFGAIREMSGLKLKRERKRFMWYCLYSLSIPMLLTSYTAAVDFLDFYGPGSRWDPQIGVIKCFFSNNASHIVHFVLPLMALSIADIVFFLLTVRHCIRVKQEISRMQSSDGDARKRFQADKAKLVMTLKLFVVMGATWLLEFLSSMFKEPAALWYISDCANALQGVPIFCIFVLKRNVYELIKVKLGFPDARRPSQVAMTATTSLEKEPKS